MIHVRRGPPPGDFGKRAKALRGRFRAARTKNPQIAAAVFWNSIRRSLREDARELARRFHFKCAYCESRMRHVSHPHIEHYRPKCQERFEDLMFDWGNWLLSCGACNDKKWAEFPEREGAPLLLDPTVDEPQDHVRFRRNLVFPLSDRGKETIRLVCLWRRDLEKERGLWLLQIDTLLLLAAHSQDDDVLRASRDALLWSMQVEAPYAAMTRQYLAEVCPKFANPAVPHPIIVDENMQQRIADLVVKHQSTACRLT